MIKTFGWGRIAFGLAALLAPALTGRLLAGQGATTPDAKAFLRGMGGRELGVGLGLLAAEREGAAPHPWLLAAALSDASDVAGILGGWRGLDPAKRGSGVAMAGSAMALSLVLLASQPPAFERAS